MAGKVKLTVACGDYEIVRALKKASSRPTARLAAAGPFRHIPKLCQ